ncbi:MAG TPA: 4-phosphoerythronate dehydrogenase PdxB [Bacteroidales bacterium]|jgi:erythronate-4-phosphate dehydrogenase|nr:4-phosphoerythronate dehydrogenase PdxB [Bacteroidales bacterium]
MKIVADDKIPFLRGALEPFAEVIYVPGKAITKEIIRDADALLIRTRTKCTPELLQGSAVRFIGTATIGFDHLNTNYCEENDIKWTNAPGCNSSSVQQYITAALLKLSRDHNFPLKGKVLGIVGVGNVGTKVEKAARALGMEVMLNDPPRERKEGKGNFVLLGDILYNADIITVHVPLNFVGEDATWHMFNEKSFKKMRKGTWFINAARGEVVDTASIRKAISGDKIRAVLDVWENEPDIDNTLMHQAFLATPHIAGYSTDGKANGTAMSVNALCSFFGLPIDSWYPKDVPPPPDPVIIIDGKGMEDYDIIRQAVNRTYSIEHDDIRLRLSPRDFEKQRGDYRLRREFTAYSVKLKNAGTDVRKILRDLGFNLV